MEFLNQRIRVQNVFKISGKVQKKDYTRPKASGSSSRFQGGGVTGKGQDRDAVRTRQRQDRDKIGTR